MLTSFLSKANVFAVVGASRHEEKYGFKVYTDLLEAGYIVYPVNPNEKEILGNSCFASLAVLPQLPDVVVFVTQPSVTESVLELVHALGITHVWMQPGAASAKAIAFCTAHNILLVHDVCIMIQRQ